MPQNVSANSGFSFPEAMWPILQIQELAISHGCALPCREPFLIGKMPTRLFACSSVRAAPARGLHMTLLVPLVLALEGPPFLAARFPTKSLWNRINFSFPCRTYRSSIKGVMRFHPGIAEPKRSALNLTHVSQACLSLFGSHVSFGPTERRRERTAICAMASMP